MTFDEIKTIAETWFEWDDNRREVITYTSTLLFAQAMYQRGQLAERDRIRQRVKEAAEGLWCIRNQVGEEPYTLYIGPSLDTLEQFVENLLSDKFKANDTKPHE